MRSAMLVTALLTSTTLASCKDREPDRASPLAAIAKDCRDAELSCPRPIFVVENLRASQTYYRDALGFEIDWDYGDPPDFGAVSRSETVLFLSQVPGQSHGSWVMVFTKDVDKLHQELVRRKAIIKMAPKNMPWGTREMHVADPDGNMIRFGGPTGSRTWAGG